ncbi:hypothetical protein BH10PLA1_BH10PLA1_17930 [soil metagenome]
MNELLLIGSALSDQNRVRALVQLEGGEMCVCQIIELLQLSPSTVSKHMSILRQAGLVEARKDGRWMYYRLATSRGESSVAAIEAVKWVRRTLAGDKLVADDRRRVEAILCENPEDLCKRQMCKSDSTCCSSAPATPAAARWQKGSRKLSKAT